MYVILVYDIGEKRVGKMLKLCRRYLTWIQNSVFEGEITKGRLAALKSQAEEIMQDNDSLILFKSRNNSWLEKEILGEERGETSNFL